MAEISSSSFSEVDGSNNSPAPSGFPEGMNMSGLNDSGRGVMGALKRAWGRLNGRYASTGSSNAYVLTPDVALAAYVLGERYSFRASFANTGSASLNISSLGAKTIKKYTATGTATLAANDIVSGQPVTVEYDGTDLILVTPHANAAQVSAIKIGQVVSTQTGAVGTGTTTIPLDDTIPQNTEGDQYMTLAITPANASSTLLIDVVWVGASSAQNTLIVPLFQDTTANALAVGVQRASEADQLVSVKFTHKMTAGTTSATTFKVRAGTPTAGTTTFNGRSAGRLFGGVSASSITITEVLP